MVHRRIGATGAALTALSAALLLWTALSFPLLSLVLVTACLVLGGVSLWSCHTLLGPRSTLVFVAAAAVLGWLAEETGVSFGWFFGSYYYTDVLGPRLGAVPLVIPVMWFGLCYTGFAMACLVLWRQPCPPAAGWKAGGLAALLTAMIVTAFDLGADPYFVYVLKAWIMEKKGGGWFGETVKGFEGWMVVSFVITCFFQATARPRLAATGSAAAARRAALAPILVFSGLIVFQVTQTQPIALRIIAFFAMGIPALIAAVAWSQWARTLEASHDGS
ncbi:MAG: carotenoid biosynthesis protein [Burkholderiales bacterium]|nr:carotenoid biosynthesis protein [Burkholderiales bacterium]